MLKRVLSAAVMSLLFIGAVCAQPAWTVPDPNTLPDDAFGRIVRYGRDLVMKSSSLIGPDAPDPTDRKSVV